MKLPWPEMYNNVKSLHNDFSIIVSIVAWFPGHRLLTKDTSQCL